MLPSAVVTSYCVYLCYSALASEPTTYRCNPRGIYADDGKASEVTSTVLTLVSVAYSSVRAGSRGVSFLFRVSFNSRMAN